MAKICPITNEYVLYPECLECEEKICKKQDNGQETTKKENEKI